MLKTTRKIALAIVLAMVLLAVAVFTAISSPQPEFIFSGMRMQKGSNGQVQGFVDMRLKGINATAVAFNIKYDKEYIVPSDYSTNDEATDLSTIYMQNTTDFPADGLTTETEQYDGSFYMSIAPNKAVLNKDEDNGAIKFFDDYEEEGTSYFYMAAADYTDGLDLGELSFQVVKPAEVSQMTEEELKNIFSVEENSAVVYYYDNENRYCQQKISYEWNVEATVIDAQPAASDVYVLASDLYGVGGEQDLIDFLNLNHRLVRLEWSDGDITWDNITWDISKCTFDPAAYDPKGGIYTVSQHYKGNVYVVVTVHVEPVKLLRFQADNQSITYAPNSQPQTFDVDALELPKKATPILDKVVTRYALSDVDVDAETWDPGTLSADFINSVQGTYEFKNSIAETDITDLYDITDLEADAPWLTTDGADRNIAVYRTIGSRTTAPLETEIAAEVDKLTGILTINAAALNGTQIADNTTFRVKFPNGYILDAAYPSSDPIMTATVADGAATIEIDTKDLTDSLQDAIQSLINLGGDGFALAATAPDKMAEDDSAKIETAMGESDFTDFSFTKRVNYYTDDEEADYSGDRSVFFPVYAGMYPTDIATHVNLVGSDSVRIAYDGMIGREPATMKEVQVDGWTLESTSSLPLAAGETVTLVGTMTDNHYYTNHGHVTNSETPVYQFRLTVTVQDKEFVSDVSEFIEVTTNETDVYKQVVDENNDFYFDTKQVGYKSAQQQTFTIHNLGNEDIEGLDVRINSTDFILVGLPDLSLEKKPGKTTFTISTKTGLPARDKPYEATVTISSGRTADLEHFTIYFTVTDEEVFPVIVLVDNDSLGFGDARVIGSTYYAAGETVTLLATPANPHATYEFYEFDHWESADVGSIHMSTIHPTETFTMPGQSVTITAFFRETTQGKLRLDDLKVQNPDSTDNDLRDTTDHLIIPFSPNVTEYYVIVPYETEQNKILVKPKYPNIDGTPIVPIFEKDGTAPPISSTPYADGYYETALFALNEPEAGTGEGKETVITITQAYDGVETVYTVTILRKPKVGVTLISGNSPFGLIEADDTIDQQTAKDYFTANRGYDPANKPAGAENTEGEKYYTDAWPHKNYDEDPNALFVYSGKAFVDPGFTGLVNAAGDSVPAADVTRTIKIAELNDPSATDAALKLTNTTEVTDTILSGGESCVISTMANYNVRPGVYKLVYSFTDSDGTTNSFSRPLIVLYEKGDTDGTNAVDTTDYDNLYNRMGNGISSGILNNPADWCAVYTYRICDVNSDRNVNSIDANNMKTNQSFTQFYEELPTS